MIVLRPEMMWSVLIASSILPNPSSFQLPFFFQRRLSSVALYERCINPNLSRRRYFRRASHAAAGIGMSSAEDDTAIIISSSISSRRSFLTHFSITSITTLPIILLPTLTFAYNDEDNDRSSVDNSMGREDSITAATIVETTSEEDTATTININKNKVAIEKLLKEENELLNNIVQEEQDESKSIQEEQVLMNELVNEIQQLGEESNASSSNTSDSNGSLPPTAITNDEKIAGKIKLDTEALIKDEERIKSETIDIITKLQDMESLVQTLDNEDSAVVVVDEESKSSSTDSNSDTATAATTATTTTTTTVEVIVEKLKERVNQKDDLITRLKEQSLQRDIDPKTKKYKIMTPKEYKQRVKSTDVDFIQFLKDTIGNEKELKADLDAFEGLIRKEIGPLILEIQKDILPIVDMVEKEWDKDGTMPVMKEMIQQFKDTTSKSNNEVDEVQQRVGDLIDKLRSMF